MKTRSPDPRLIIPTLWCLALAAVACADRSAEVGSALLPAQLHGLQLVESHSGEEAEGIIARLHKGDMAPAQTEIGIYGSEGMRAELYISVFNNSQDATSQFESMVDGIMAGVPGFGHHTHFQVDEQDVHMVFGDGRVNYFFCAGERLSWLGANPLIARAAIAELLEVDLDLIPELPGMGSNPSQPERS